MTGCAQVLKEPSKLSEDAYPKKLGKHFFPQGNPFPSVSYLWPRSMWELPFDTKDSVGLGSRPTTSSEPPSGA
jgi:hypothetical protein